MKAWNLFLAMNLLWLLSEILIGRLTFRKDASQLDRKSLRLLWVTILVCVSLGVFVGLQRWAALPFPSKWMLSIGTTLIGLGLLVRWQAMLTLRRFFTSNVQILENHQLVDKGLYAYIRHPAYAGSLLSFLGLGLALNSWLSLLIIFVPIFLAFVRRMNIEEQALLQALGSTYQQYRQRTARLLPFIY